MLSQDIFPTQSGEGAKKNAKGRSLSPLIREIDFPASNDPRAKARSKQITPSPDHPITQ